MASPPRLQVLSETRYNHRVPEGFPVACPTLDLSVTWDAAAGNLLICRPPDHVVSRIHHPHARPGVTGPSPQAVAWKPDGRFVAVGWSDGYVRLMGLENNKVAHHIQISADPQSQPPPPPPPPRITHIGWVRSRVGPPHHRLRARLKGETYTRAATRAARLGLWESEDGEDGKAGEAGEAGFSPSNVADLPKQLTFLEVESALPDLSPLPSASAGAGEDARVFTLRTGIEFLFQPLQREDWDHLHVIVIGSDDGKLHLNIFDSFVIGEFACPSPLEHDGSGFRLVHHAAHPDVTTHSLLLQSADPCPTAVYLALMDLPFLDSSLVNMVLLASKLTTLQKLLRYLHQTRLHMEVEWKNTRELPVRFLSSVQDDLDKRDDTPRQISDALFHSVVMGHTHAPVKEWLTDSVGERGHKRWDKAVVSGLAGLRSLVLENFLPAIDRAAIIISRLRGLALFHVATHDKLGFTAAQTERLADVLSTLSYTGHIVLQLATEELDKFNAFSTWLRFRIDSLDGANASAAVAKEMLEKEAAIDVTRVLGYIKRFLPKVSSSSDNASEAAADSGPLGVFLDPPSPDELASCRSRGLGDGSESLMDLLDQQLRKKRTGKPYEKHLATVAFLDAHLSDKADEMFSDIAGAHKRGVRFGRVTRLCIGRPISKMDTAVHAVHRQKSTDGVTYTVLGSHEHESEVWIFRSSIRVVNGISDAVATQVCVLRLPDGGGFVDYKFLDNETLLALCRNGRDHHPSIIRQIPFRHPDMPYVDYIDGHPPPASVLGRDVLGRDGDVPAFGLPEALLRTGLTTRMEVRDGTSARGWLPPRACLLSPDGTTYTVLTLPGDGDAAKTTG